MPDGGIKFVIPSKPIVVNDTLNETISNDIVVEDGDECDIHDDCISRGGILGQKCAIFTRGTRNVKMCVLEGLCGYKSPVTELEELEEMIEYDCLAHRLGFAFV